MMVQGRFGIRTELNVLKTCIDGQKNNGKKNQMNGIVF